MAIMTKVECKAFLNITDTTYDDWIDVLIPSIESYIKEYCNNDFLDDDDEEVWSEAIKMTAAQMIQFQMNTLHGVSAHSLEGVSTQFLADYPDFIFKLLKRYKKVKFV